MPTTIAHIHKWHFTCTVEETLLIFGILGLSYINGHVEVSQTNVFWLWLLLYEYSRVTCSLSNTQLRVYFNQNFLDLRDKNYLVYNCYSGSVIGAYQVTCRSFL